MLPGRYTGSYTGQLDGQLSNPAGLQLDGLAGDQYPGLILSVCYRRNRAPERFQIISGRGCARVHIRDLLPKRGAHLRLCTS